MHRLLIAFTVFAFGLIAAPADAHAHARLDRASPGAGSTLAAAPAEVVLRFTENLEPAFSTIVVRDAKGAAVQSGKARIDPKQPTQMRVPLKPLVPGVYKVIWRILSVDTHRAQGEFIFHVGP